MDGIGILVGDLDAEFLTTQHASALVMDGPRDDGIPHLLDSHHHFDGIKTIEA